MGYASFKESPKSVTKSEDIGPGQIELRHLSPSLYSELRNVNTHNHSGVKSQKIELKNLGGAWPKSGFYMFSNDGAKRYAITINNSGNLIATEV
jgi:hypothetical protein